LFNVCVNKPSLFYLYQVPTVRKTSVTNNVTD